MTPSGLVAALEARGVELEPDRLELVVRPADKVTATEMAILKRMKADVLGLLRGRTLGVDWWRGSLYQLDRILEVSVPWAEVSIIIAPGCRIARELRSTDPKPGRVWCVCEVLDLLRLNVPPADAQRIALARLTFDADMGGVKDGQP